MVYKMKGFSGFGNSPLKQKKEKKEKFEYSKEQVLGGKPFPDYDNPGKTEFPETHWPPSKLDKTRSTVKGKKRDIEIIKRGGGHGEKGGNTEKIIKKKRRSGKVKKKIEYFTIGDKTSKRVTKYKKSGEIKKEKPSKRVKSKEKHKQHKEKHQEKLSKIETTYKPGMARMTP